MNERTIKIDGNSIRYIEEGTSKKNLLLIHGLGASAERWEHVIPQFSKNYRVLVPDLIGFGLSDKPLVDYTTDYLSKFIRKFLKKLNIDSVSIIGSSLGGQIGVEFTHKNNSMVKKLILVSPSGVMKHSTPALDAYVMAALYPTNSSASNAFQMMSASKKIDEKTIRGFVERMKLPNAKMAFMSTLLGLKNAEITSVKLVSIKSPTLIIWGENDLVIPIKYAQSFVSQIDDCRFVKMENCGHTPYVEVPDKFYKIVSNFLK
ncbi:MAG: alpha/beta hydrolase [Crenarchaeota archaeon]|nr:alpha/beta hydrolase [Thermoproteota archaeon]MDA1124668.1 alpha/beta hydrolase [Thermoproteota archaeon]